jgi:hypothetical protein
MVLYFISMVLKWENIYKPNVLKVTINYIAWLGKRYAIKEDCLSIYANEFAIRMSFNPLSVEEI